MSEFFTEAIDIVDKYQQDAFREEGKPNAWQGLAPSTLKARARRTGYYRQQPSGQTGILHWTGRLENSNKKTITDTQGKLEKTAPYAKFHQYGGKNLPQRKMLTLDPRAAAEITRSLQKKIQRDIGLFGLQA